MSKTKHKTAQGNEYTIHGGVYEGYTFEDKDKKSSVLAFETVHEAKEYLEKRDVGIKHFCDNL
jgi:hypothetical protein